MRKLLLAFLLINCLSSKAQDTFQKYYSYRSGCQLVAELSDSSILMFSNPAEIVKTNKDGTFIWVKSLSPSTPGDNFSCVRFLELSDGNFIMSTYTNNNYSSLIKLDSSGNIRWIKTYENKSCIASISETSDHGFIIGLHLPDTIVGNSSYNKMILKTDSAGNTSWSNLIPLDTIFNTNDFLIIQADDGGYLYQNRSNSLKLDSSGFPVRNFNCHSSFPISNTTKIIQINPNKYLMIGDQLRCVDSTGSILWEKLPQQIYTDVLKLNDTTILLIGPGFIVWQGIFIEKIDDLGNQIENSLYRINANVWGYAVDLDFENKLIIAGSTDPWQIQDRNLFLMKTDTGGYTSCGIDQSINIMTPVINQYTITNPIFIPGNITVSTPIAINTTIITSLSETIYCSTTNSITETANKFSKCLISPNPTSGSFTVEIPDPNSSAEITITNFLGQIIYNRKFDESSKIGLAISGPSGIYFAKVSTDTDTYVLQIIKE